MGADFPIHCKNLKIEITFVEKLRVQKQIFSKLLGEKSVFLKSFGAVAPALTRTLPFFKSES